MRIHADPDPQPWYGITFPLTFHGMVTLLKVDESVVLDLLDPVHLAEGLEALPESMQHYSEVDPQTL